jgi:hypothetical protein
LRLYPVLEATTLPPRAQVKLRITVEGMADRLTLNNQGQVLATLQPSGTQGEWETLLDTSAMGEGTVRLELLAYSGVQVTSDFFDLTLDEAAPWGYLVLPSAVKVGNAFSLTARFFRNVERVEAVIGETSYPLNRQGDGWGATLTLPPALLGSEAFVRLPVTVTAYYQEGGSQHQVRLERAVVILAPTP